MLILNDYQILKFVFRLKNLNTSYVDIKLVDIATMPHTYGFKYILC